jgi:hypothetical protein
LADHLSKAKFKAFREAAAAAGWPLHEAPAGIPKVLLRWLDRPGPYDGLGAEILKEIGGQVPIAGYTPGWQW